MIYEEVQEDDHFDGHPLFYLCDYWKKMLYLQII